MCPITTSTPITGKENYSSFLNETTDKRVQALSAFYKAFNERDILLMQLNWLNDKIIVMDNPLGGIKRGWEEIQAVYHRLFSSQSRVYVEFYDYTIIDLQDGFCAIGRERGFFKHSKERLDLEIRTSRLYKLVNNEFKQVHHHGSIESPQLLKTYQNMV